MRNGAINSFDSKKSLDTRNKSTSKRFCRVLPPYDLLPRKTNMRLLLFHMLERATSLQSSKNSHFLSAAKFLESWEKVCVSAARAQTCFMLDTIDQSRHDAKEAQTQHALQYHNITTAMSASSSFSGSTVTTSTQSATTDATHRSFSHTTTCASESIFSERLQ